MAKRSYSCGLVARWVVVALAASLIALVAAPAAANDREVVFAVHRAQLHVRAGEAAPIVGHTTAGDELEVLGYQGRWLRVRNGKQVGWLTRTEVSNIKPAEPHGRNQRAGFSSKPLGETVKLTIAIDHVRGFDEPRPNAKSAIELARGDAVTLIGRDQGGWLLVEDSTGKLGWIPAVAVAEPTQLPGGPPAAPPQVAAEVAAPPVASPAAVREPPVVEPRPTEPRWTGGLLATAGAQSFKMSQSGEGESTAIAAGPRAIISARGQIRIRGALWAGIAGDAALGTADLTYRSASETSNPMATRQLAIDGRGELGWGGPSYVAVRGGIHYETLKVSSDRSEPMLIGERIGGATLGVGGGLPIYRRLVLSAAVDVMPLGAQKLSRLPAGTLYATSVREISAHGSLSMALPAHLLAAVCYQFGALTAELTDGAAAAKTASRTDQSHVVTAGIGMIW